MIRDWLSNKLDELLWRWYEFQHRSKANYLDGI